ncbi:MAG: NADH-quinone oxidoreductase subunit NuoG [Anaerolineales bacterium]|nr:NADH-quinone oxidoreductase subunit NuoG [Anaerolineales bacterium]
MTDRVTLTIDGKQVTVPAGMLVVDAAKKVAVHIPIFCYHPKLGSAAMCRQCLVEVGRPIIDHATGHPELEDGFPRIQFSAKLETACTTLVSEGMVVLTQSERARKGQKEVLEFLLTSHPLDCPICDKGGECPLQNLTMAHGPGKSRFLFDEKHHAEKQVPLGELIFLDRERCIQCGRCVRFQENVAGEPVIGFYQRGRSMDIVSFSEPGFDSVFSGNTTDICPVGALTTADFRFGARPWELMAAASICSQCAVGCNTTLNTRREARSDGQIVVKRVMPRQNEQVNELWICDKGRFAGYHYTERDDRLLKPQVRRDDKFRSVSWDAAFLQAAEKLQDAEKPVFLVSGRLSNEDLFNLLQLADGLGAETLLYTNMGGGDLTGMVGLTSGSNLADLGLGDVILVVASDLQEEAPLWWLRIKQAAERGAMLIVVNPRETKLEKHADYVVRYAYGDEIKTIQDMNKATHKIHKVFAKAANAVIFYGSEGLGLEGSSGLAGACTSLLVDTGHYARPNNGLVGVWQRANDQGAWELGFRPVKDLQVIFDKSEVVYIVGADPVGDGAVRLKKRKPFMIVQELLSTDTVGHADLVLPARAFTEREGTYTSGERRVQRFYQAVPPRGESRPDYEIVAEIAARLDTALEREPGLVMDQLAEHIPAFGGISYLKVSEVVEQWPVINRSELFYGGAVYENTQGLGMQLRPAPVTSFPVSKGKGGLRPKEGLLLAVPVNKLYDQGLTVLSAPLLRERIGELKVCMNPDEADRLGFENGARLRIGLNGNNAKALLVVDPTVPSGILLVPRSMGLPIFEAGMPVLSKVRKKVTG